MDDEAMLRLDPLLAEAFRSQLKKSSNSKIINEKLHHQFRVLDLIESVIKKDDRMKFVLVIFFFLSFQSTINKKNQHLFRSVFVH